MASKLVGAPQRSALTPAARQSPDPRRPGSPRPAGTKQEKTGLVMQFLRRHDIEPLAALLFEQGFDELDTLVDVDEAVLQEVSIEYITRLCHCVQKLRTGEGGSGETARSASLNPVEAFLGKNSLGQYAPALLQNGFDDMTTLLEIGDEDLEEAGLLRGHALKLRRHLREHPMTR